MSSFTRIADKRQVENSPLLAILALCRETELGQRTPLSTNIGIPLLEVSRIASSWIESAQFGSARTHNFYANNVCDDQGRGLSVT